MSKATTQMPGQSYTWRSYDVWGNAKDGYEVNQSFTTNDKYNIPAIITTEQGLFNCLKKQGFFKKRIYRRLLEIEWNDNTIYFTYKGRPEGELRKD